LNTKKDILKNFRNQTFAGPHWLPWYRQKKNILWKSMGTSNCLVTVILQNIFLYFQQKKELLAGLEQFEGE